MMVIEIETGKKKRIRAAEFIGQWLTDGKEKYKKIEKSIASMVAASIKPLGMLEEKKVLVINRFHTDRKSVV